MASPLAGSTDDFSTDLEDANYAYPQADPFGNSERDFNRRALPRKRSQFHVSFRFGGNMEMARGIDVSESGLAFYSGAKITQGQELELVLCPTVSGPRTSLKSVVRHARGGKIGVQFERLTLEQRSMLMNAVALSL